MLYHYGLWWTHTLTKWCTSTYHQSAINPMENPSLNKQPGFGRSLWDSRGRCLWSAVKQWGSLPVVPVDPIWVFDNDLGLFSRWFGLFSQWEIHQDWGIYREYFDAFVGPRISKSKISVRLWTAPTPRGATERPKRGEPQRKIMDSLVYIFMVFICILYIHIYYNCIDIMYACIIYLYTCYIIDYIMNK